MGGPNAPREPYAGPESGPETPFPIKLYGPVIKGFGRGSKELGIPTANIPPEGLASYPSLESGVYFGWVGLSISPDTPSSSTQIYPSVLSIGYNPFYKNTVRSVEIHILHDFDYDFYGAALNLLILGFIRPEYDYVSLEALVQDIKTDCEVARRSLQRPAYEKFKDEPWLKDFDWMKTTDTAKVEKEILRKE
ncbi:riboflavin kinase [Exophiala dermatitidis]|uniref:Riboflavin kinase n=2 Tax=Exophiala dermatitidis TaxID=5970 RepID=H6C9H0_EXODN